MNREEAIDKLQDLWNEVYNEDSDGYDYAVAIDMAIDALQAQPTHGRLIDADALSKKLCETTIFIKDGEVFQHMINDAPTVPIVDITQRDLCEDISCTDCPFMKETCKLMDYVAYADRPHGEWVGLDECSVCGKQAFDFIEGCVEGVEYLPNFCPNCGARMKGGEQNDD